MNLVAGYMYVAGYRLEETVQSSDSPPQGSTLISSVQEKYLNNVRYLLGRGVHRLVDDVQNVVAQHLR